MTANAGLAELLFGFDTAVVAGVVPALRSRYALTAVQLGVAVSAALWGTLSGAVTVGAPGDRYGSRTILRLIAWIHLVSAVGGPIAWNLASFLSFSLLTGLAIGGSSVLAPASKRGALVGLFQFNIVLGILVTYLSNFVIDAVKIGEYAWRHKLGAAVVPELAFLLLLRAIPNSPRWLHRQGQRDEAARAYASLGIQTQESLVALDA